jgi:hypothetical protein
MTQNLAPFTPKKYSLKTVELLWNETLYTRITNTDYEGEIKKAGDRVVVRTAQKLTLSAYTKGMTLSTQDLNPSSEELIVDQQYYFKFIVDDVDKLQNDIDEINITAANSKRDISELIDTDILSYAWKQVHGLNAIGTNYSTGTVAIAATTGVVTGTGTTFTAAMVGAPFKAAGHTKYYRIATYTSATSITIIDLDGVAYTGGVIGAGATYVAYAATAIAVTKSTIYGYLVDLKTALSKRLTPRTGRFLVVNADAEGLILKAPEFIPAVGDAYAQAVKQGMIGKIAGFDVYFSELIAGDNTNGYYFLAGDKSFIAFAMQIMDVVVIPSATDPNSFVSTCKGLVTWGRKVFEGNRGRGAYLRATI